MNNAEFVASLKQLCRQAGYIVNHSKNFVDATNFTKRHIIVLEFSKIFTDDLVGSGQMELLEPDEFFLTGEL